MKARVAVGAALVALAGCGGGGAQTPAQVASKTAAKLPDIRSGDMRVELAATGRGGGQTAKLGFKLAGPFALARGGGLPVAKLRYTQISGDQQGSATFISTGREAFVQGQGGGAARPLPAKQTQRLRAAAGQVSQNGGVRKLDLERWMRNPKLDGGPPVGGDATDRIRAAVNVPAVAKDLAGRLGDTKTLERAIKSARVELLTGTKDRLLRRLTLDVNLALDVPQGLKQQLGKLVGGDVRLVFEVADPNRKVSVPRPATG